MDFAKATKEEVVAELALVLKSLRGVIETESLPPCDERSSALHYLNKHQSLLPDDHRWTVSTSRGRTWEHMSGY